MHHQQDGASVTAAVAGPTPTAAPDGWQAIAGLVDEVAADRTLVDHAVSEVQQTVAPVGELDPADVAHHSHLLLAAALRAIVERRGPTDTELDFISALAVTRAKQGVAIESVLAGIHVAQRHIWRRARQVARERGLDPELLMDASDLYDEWAQQVRARLIVAHRRTELERAQSERDRRGAALRRIVEGDPAAMTAARGIGLDPELAYHVVRLRLRTEEEAAPLEDALRGTGASALFGRMADDLVGLVARPPTAQAGRRVGRGVGLAGPVPLVEVPVAFRYAGRARAVADERGLVGLHHVTDFAFAIVTRAEPELGRALADRLLTGFDREDEFARVLVHTAATYLEHGQRVGETAAALYVHPNTIRYRLARFTEVAGPWPDRMDDAIHLRWAARHWLD